LANNLYLPCLESEIHPQHLIVPPSFPPFLALRPSPYAHSGGAYPQQSNELTIDFDECSDDRQQFQCIVGWFLWASAARERAGSQEFNLAHLSLSFDSIMVAIYNVFPSVFVPLEKMFL